ncbi:MAG: hypothetical protein IT186_24750, partial [Acidobacteria bacterium]|nr:hypothetical protein [Acidobacteriota bacterium]
MVRRILPLCVLAVLLACPALAIVDKVQACGKDFSSTARVPLIIGRTNTIKVFGAFVDTANRIEDAGLPGVKGSITARSGGTGSNITIEINIADSAK